MTRFLFAATLTSTLLCLPAFADEEEGPAVETARSGGEEKPSPEEMRARKAALEQARDAALIKANTYGLPQHRLQAVDAQNEIDEISKELGDGEGSPEE